MYSLALRGLGIVTLGVLAFLGWRWVFTARDVLKAIHCKQRLLCGIDAALAVLVTHIYLTPTGMNVAEMATGAVATALIGAVIGVLHFKLISVYVFGVQPSTT